MKAYITFFSILFSVCLNTAVITAVLIIANVAMWGVWAAFVLLEDRNRGIDYDFSYHYAGDTRKERYYR